MGKEQTNIVPTKKTNKKINFVSKPAGVLAADISRKKISYLWYPWLLANQVNVISGAQGTNKSTFATYIAAKLSRSENPAGEELPSGAGKTLYYGMEDEPQVIVDRYKWFDGNLGKLRIVNSHVIDEEEFPVSFEESMLIERDIATFHPKLVIFDVFRLCFGSWNITEAKHVNKVFSMMKKWCEKYQCTILLIHHSKQNPITREDCLEGSIALRRAIRSAAYISRFGIEGDNCRVLAPYKVSWAKEPTPLHFYINSGGENNNEMRIEMGGESEFNLDEIVSLQAKYAGTMAKARLKKLGVDENIADI